MDEEAVAETCEKVRRNREEEEERSQRGKG